MSDNRAANWLQRLTRLTLATVITDESGVLTLGQGVSELIAMMQGRTTYIIGNGGSLAIAAHLATDFNLTGLRTIALSDSIALTSNTNDFGHESMFTAQLEWLADADDTLIALSCSGESPNVVEAARYAKAHGIGVVTFSGFDHDNPLRSLGALNFYVPAARGEYGFVQLAHEAVLHAACDIEAGFGADV